MPKTTLIVWFGGKGTLAPKIIPHFPEHKIYVEPFGGGAAIMLQKKPSDIEVYNDLDSGLVNFFRVIRDRDLFKRFYETVNLYPYSREEYYHCKKTWMECKDPVDKAIKWFVVARWSFSGSFGASWSHTKTHSRRGMSGPISRWLTCLDKLPEIVDRLKQIQVEQKDYVDIIEQYDNKETLFYVDPPYFPETRSAGKYTFELSESDHVNLLDMLLQIKGKFVLSGYHNALYDCMLDSFDVIEIETVCHAAAKTKATGLKGKGSLLKNQKRTEVLWIKR